MEQVSIARRGEDGPRECPLPAPMPRSVSAEALPNAGSRARALKFRPEPWFRTCAVQPASRRRAWRRSRTTTGGRPGLLGRTPRARSRPGLAAGRVRRCGAVGPCRPRGGLPARQSRPRLRGLRLVLLGSWSWLPPSRQELGSRWHRVDHGGSLIVIDDADLERLCSGCRTDVHGDGRVVGLERSPMVAHCTQHVVVGGTVLAGTCFDVHQGRRYPDARKTSTHVDGCKMPPERTASGTTPGSAVHPSGSARAVR